MTYLKFRIPATLIIVMIATSAVLAQAHDEHDSHEDSHDFLKHSLALEFGYTYIPEGFSHVEGDEAIFVPTWGLAYSYRFNHKWGFSLMANVETGKYLISVNREDIPRENVFIFTTVATYELAPNWGLFFGPGIELESNKNFPVFRIGTEYGFELNNNWKLAPMLTFDYKIDYTSLELAIALAKRF